MFVTSALAVAFLPACLGLSVPSNAETGQTIIHEAPIPVPVVLGVMSRCPDALLCESVFDRVISKVGHEKVDLSLTFIGTRNRSEPEYGATCKHGPGECLGNIHELCAIAHTPSSQQWWPFLQCINYEGSGRIGLDKVSRDCAAVSGIDWEGSGIAKCVSGKEGKKLLRKSIKRTKKMGIKNSCTILINNALRCIRDSKWKQCDEGHEPVDFVDTINKEYAKLNPPTSK